jgi:predicted dehydrogenase
VETEKPAAGSVSEIDRLVLTAKSTGANLYFFQNSRFASWFAISREVLASGVLGRPVQFKLRYSSFGRRWDWQTLQRNNGGSLRNTGPHPMDQAVVLMGNAAMPEIFCHFDRVNTWGDAEDFVKVIMRVPRGPVVDLEISSCDCYPGPILSVQAQYGTLRADRESVTWRYFDPKTAPPQKLTHAPIEKPDGTPSYCVEKLEWTEKTAEIGDGAPAIGAQPPDAPTETLYNKLYAHIAEGAEYEITGEQVRQQIAIMERCHQIYPLSRLLEG